MSASSARSKWVTEDDVVPITSKRDKCGGASDKRAKRVAGSKSPSRSRSSSCEREPNAFANGFVDDINEFATASGPVDRRRSLVDDDLAAISSRPNNAKVPSSFDKPPGTRKNDDLLQNLDCVDSDESYKSQETALAEFLKLHPMLSLESTNFNTLQLASNLIDDAAIATKELEVVSKSYDDLQLRPPNEALNERQCCLGDRCICVWLARWRYGDDTEMAFVGNEFLLPSQRKVFEETGALPPTQGKCLVCSRYYHTYIYRLARSDPTFRANCTVPLQAFGNALTPQAGEMFPTHSSIIHGEDGYSSDAMLFVDEGFTDTIPSRSSMGTFLWRPVVKFVANHYEYVKDPSSGHPRMIQVGVGSLASANPDATAEFPAASTEFQGASRTTTEDAKSLPVFRVPASSMD